MHPCMTYLLMSYRPSAPIRDFNTVTLTKAASKSYCHIGRQLPLGISTNYHPVRTNLIPFCHIGRQLPLGISTICKSSHDNHSPGHIGRQLPLGISTGTIRLPIRWWTHRSYRPSAPIRDFNIPGGVVDHLGSVRHIGRQLPLGISTNCRFQSSLLQQRSYRPSAPIRDFNDYHYWQGHKKLPSSHIGRQLPLGISTRCLGRTHEQGLTNVI